MGRRGNGADHTGMRRPYRSTSFVVTTTLGLMIVAFLLLWVAFPSAQARAEDEADARADGALAAAAAYKGTHLDAMAAAAGAGVDSEIMSITGDQWDEGATIVLRLDFVSRQKDHFAFQYSFTEVPIVRCYELTVRRVPAWEFTREHIECPPGPPLDVPPLPTMPRGTAEHLETALRSFGYRDRTPEHVQDAVADVVTGREVTVEVATDGEWIGVAINVRRDCVFGRVWGGRVEVWVPPDVLVQPGEYGCRPEVAAAGLAKDAPH